MKGYRFYAEMEDARCSKSASKRWSPFTRGYLQNLAAGSWHNNCIAVLLDESGQPLWCGKDRDQMDAICPVNGRPNASVELGLPSIGYLRTRCVRISAELAKKLHPNLFTYLEAP
jgi:hypothetical protein